MGQALHPPTPWTTHCAVCALMPLEPCDNSMCVIARRLGSLHRLAHAVISKAPPRLGAPLFHLFKTVDTEDKKKRSFALEHGRPRFLWQRVFHAPAGRHFWHTKLNSKICDNLIFGNLPSAMAVLGSRRAACFYALPRAIFGTSIFSQVRCRTTCIMHFLFVVIVLEGSGVVAHVAVTTTLPVLDCLLWVQLLLRRGLERKPLSLRKKSHSQKLPKFEKRVAACSYHS